MTVSYDRGDEQRLKITFTDYAGADADPDNVKCIITDPAALQTEFIYLTDAELVKDAVGQYHIDYEFTQSGRYIIRFEGAGTITNAEETEVYIKRSR